MSNEKVTGLYFYEESNQMWVLYTKKSPEKIDGIDKLKFCKLLKLFTKTDRSRYQLYHLLLFNG